MKKLIYLIAAAVFICTAAIPQAQQQPSVTTTPVVKSVPTQVPSTQITTTAPVSSDTTISVGTLAGQVLTWIAAAFSIPIGGLIVFGLQRFLVFLGIQVTAGMRAQLQSVVVNGLNSAAAANSERLKGMGQVEIKNVIVADAIKYTQEHAAETIKALGLDPHDGAAVEAIKARIETAITDPNTPTPVVISPPGAEPKSAAPVATVTVTETKRPVA